MQTNAGEFTPRHSYFELVREFPLRPIRSDAEYKRAAAVMERLAVRGEDDLDAGERDYLNGLDEFISSYDRKALANRPRRGTPVQRLRALMTDSGVTPRDLGKIFQGGHSLVSLVLNGKRELSKTHMRRLAARFKVEPGLFL